MVGARMRVEHGLYEHSMARFAVTEQNELVGRKLVVVKVRVKLLL